MQGRSRQPSGLRHALTSLARKPGPLVLILLRAWMYSVCVCVCVFLCLCTGRGLTTSWSPVQGVLLTVPDQETEETQPYAPKAGASSQVWEQQGRKNYKYAEFPHLGPFFLSLYFVYDVSFLYTEHEIGANIKGYRHWLDGFAKFRVNRSSARKLVSRFLDAVSQQRCRLLPKDQFKATSFYLSCLLAVLLAYFLLHTPIKQHTIIALVFRQHDSLMQLFSIHFIAIIHQTAGLHTWKTPKLLKPRLARQRSYGKMESKGSEVTVNV
jgi:hypothetical protein